MLEENHQKIVRLLEVDSLLVSGFHLPQLVSKNLVLLQALLVQQAHSQQDNSLLPIVKIISVFVLQLTHKVFALQLHIHAYQIMQEMDV